MTQAAANRHVVIVGASLAGTRTAQRLRALGHAGDITLIGAEPELPYDRPPLSKALLRGEWSEAAAEEVRLISQAELDTLGVELRLGSPATGLDTDVRAEHWTNASDQARYVASAIVNGSETGYQPTDYVWSDQYDWKVIAFGWRDPAGSSVVIGDLAANGKAAVVHADAAGTATGAVTVNWVRALTQARRRLAAGEPAAAIADAIRQLPA